MQKQLSQKVIQELAAKGRKSLFFLTKAILGFDKFSVEIHKPLCDLIQDYEKNTRNCLILPRGWYKSTMATIAYPIWRAINNPESRGLIVQNTYTNACGKLGAIKQIFETNELFKLLYPEILPTRDHTWAKDAATVNRHGAYPEATWEAAGTGTQKTGQHYDYIIEDDTVSPDKDNLTGAMLQPTQAEIEKAIGWFRLATPLLIEPVDSQRIVVGTRWAENDLLGFIIDNHPEYNILTRAVRETDGRPDPAGEIQWSKRFGESVLKALEVDLGPYCFSCNPGDASILMSDFTNKSIKDIAINDTIVGFKLSAGKGKNNSTLVKTTVINKGYLKQETVKVTLESGRVIRCTKDHEWLQDPNHSSSRPQSSYRSLDYVPTNGHQWQHRLYYVTDGNIPKLTIEQKIKAAWIAGMIDADGHVSKKNICIFQDEKSHPEICQRIRDYLTDLGFEFSEYLTLKGKHLRTGKIYDTRYIFFHIKGGFEAKIKFLSYVPSLKVKRVLDHLYQSRHRHRDNVVKIEPYKKEKVYWLTTTTGNYICWGYCSKNSLYLNSPTDASNQLFKRDWIHYYTTVPANLYVCTSVDLASAEKEESSDPDYNVVVTAGINPKNGHIYVLHYTRERMSPSSLIQCIFDHHRAYKPTKVIIEGIGYQRTFVHWLEQRQRKLNNMFYVETITSHKGSKSDRVRGLQPYFASTKVFLRHGMDDLERELLAFPKGAHDDIVDALSMQLNFWNVTTTLVDDEKSERLARNPFSADAIIKELEDRNKLATTYPYDIGIMSHRIPSRRKYVLPGSIY